MPRASWPERHPVLTVLLGAGVYYKRGALRAKWAQSRVEAAEGKMASDKAWVVAQGYGDSVSADTPAGWAARRAEVAADIARLAANERERQAAAAQAAREEADRERAKREDMSYRATTEQAAAVAAAAKESRYAAAGKGTGAGRYR